LPATLARATRCTLIPPLLLRDAIALVTLASVARLAGAFGLLTLRDYSFLNSRRDFAHAAKPERRNDSIEQGSCVQLHRFASE
jgi:hypothetical protein